MINLLPPDVKDQYLYGRRNTQLRRWAFALGAGVAGVLIMIFGGLFIMEQSITTYKQNIATTKQALKDQKLEETTQKAKDITGSIKLATTVLSREILFSELLQQIGKVTPSNTRLAGFTISKDQSAIEIQASSSDYDSATQLQVNLQDPANKIFSKADIQNITCSNIAEAADRKYPCAVTMRALLSPNNPFLFINKSGAKP